MFRLAFARVCAAAVLAALPLQSASAHGDHGAAAPAPAATVLPRVESEGMDVELVAVADGHTLTIYLDHSDTNAPVNGATVEVAGDGIATSKAEFSGDGTYVVEADWVHEPGAYALTFTVIADGLADLLAGRLVIPEPPSEEHVSSFSWQDVIVRPEAWGVAALIGLVGFFLAFAFRPLHLPPDDTRKEEAPEIPASSPPGDGARHAAAIILAVLFVSLALPDQAQAHEGHDHGATAARAEAGGNAPVRLPTGEVYLPKPAQRLLHLRTAPAAEQRVSPSAELIGTVVANPSFEGRVQAPMEGQIELAAGGVSYIGQSVKAGQVLAVLSPAMPVYDRGALQQLTAEVEGKLRIAEQKLVRLKGISGDYIPQRELDDTQTEIESLLAQKRALEPRVGEKIEMTAPVSGVISVANVRAGQVVSARETLFEIVDPEKLWIEANALAGADETSVKSATALDGEGHAIPLTYIGRAPSLRQQSQPLLFQVDDPHPSLAIGVALKVLVQSGAQIEGTVMPSGAVVRAANGLSQVWVKISPERFAPRPVRTRALDGDRVLITAGLEKKDRVVVEGAALINQIR